MKSQQFQLIFVLIVAVLATPTQATVCQGKTATIVGTAGDDRLVGTKRNDVIDGLGGNDTISGKGGNDRLCGSAGNDTLLGGAGNDKLSGGSGADTAKGGGGRDTCMLSPDDKANGCEARKADNSTDNGGGSSGSASGTLYWANGFFTASTFNLATGEKKDVARFSLDSQGQLGYGGGLFTEVESTGILPEYITVNLRDVAPNPYTLRSKLRTFPLNGFTNGPVQPSPDGRLFALATSESRGLGEERGLYVYVFDAALNIVFKLEGYQSRAWLGNDRLVVVSGNNLYSVTVTNSPIVTRIGPNGLGLPNEGVKQPSVSPDGRSIAYVQGDAIWRINVDGSGLTQLTKPYIGAEWPSWSPDGSRLIIATDCHVGQIEVNSSYTPFHIISATEANQDRDRIRPITFACGPVYWLPS